MCHGRSGRIPCDDATGRGAEALKEPLEQEDAFLAERVNKKNR